MISTAADLAEITTPGASAYLYAEVEAGAKAGGVRAIKKFQTKFAERTYSVSGIDPHDEETAMNYVGQELGIALFKSLHELPESLRKPEMFLRGIEALLTNVLNGKFSEYDPHHLLDSLCDHVHWSLHDFQSWRTTSH